MNTLYTCTLIFTLLQNNLSLENVLDSLIYPPSFPLSLPQNSCTLSPNFPKRFRKVCPLISTSSSNSEIKNGDPRESRTQLALLVCPSKLCSASGILHRGFANTEKTLWSFFCFRNPFLKWYVKCVKTHCYKKLYVESFLLALTALDNFEINLTSKSDI